jgi:DNA-binding winged helix-turn-helix (wHTH) protein
MSACLQEKWPDAAAEERDEVGVRALWPRARAAEPLPYQDLEPTEFRFGRWCLVPRARLLLCDGQPVEVGSRAFDLLHLLLCRRGFVVEKNAIVSFVWPNTIVEESNLRFQMATLRKALGPERALIKTIPGRGYILAADYLVA